MEGNITDNPGEISFSHTQEDGQICGGQIYGREARFTFMSSVRKDLNEVLSFPHLLETLLCPQSLGSGVVPYKQTRMKVHELFKRITGMVMHSQQSMEVFAPTSVRMEFFVKYNPTYNWANEYLGDFPNPACVINCYDTMMFKNYLRQSTLGRYTILKHVLDADSDHLQAHRRSDFAAALTENEIGTYMKESEHILVDLGIGTYAGYHIKKMQKRKPDLASRLDNFTIPEADLIQSSPERFQLTGLPYTIPVGQYFTRPYQDVVQDSPILVRGTRLEPHVIAEAMEMKKNVSFPLLYAQSLERIKCKLIRLTAPEVNDYYTVFEEIDYRHIAFELDDEERDSLIRWLVEELWSVYDYFWKERLNAMHKRLGLAPIRVIPKTSEMLQELLNGNEIGDGEHIKWKRIPRTDIIHTERVAGKSQHFWNDKIRVQLVRQF
jgi:hypothetical protein